MMSVIILSVLLDFIMPSVVMLNVPMLDVVLLNVVAPAFGQCNVSFSFSSFSLDATLANICFLSSFKIEGEFTFAIACSENARDRCKNALDIMPRKA